MTSRYAALPGLAVTTSTSGQSFSPARQLTPERKPIRAAKVFVPKLPEVVPVSSVCEAEKDVIVDGGDNLVTEDVTSQLPQLSETTASGVPQPGGHSTQVSASGLQLLENSCTAVYAHDCILQALKLHWAKPHLVPARRAHCRLWRHLCP